MNETLSQSNPLNFGAQVLQSNLPILVNFWAEWGAPCKAMALVFCNRHICDKLPY